MNNQIEYIVSKEIAIALRNKGFNEHCDNRYNEETNELINWKNKLVNELISSNTEYLYKEVPNLANEYYAVFINDDFGYYVSAPTNEQAVNWILKQKLDVEWLKFWHTTLLANNFALLDLFELRANKWYGNRNLYLSTFFDIPEIFKKRFLKQRLF